MPDAFVTLSLHSRYAFAKFSNLQFLILIPSFHEHLQQTSIFFKTTNFLSCPLFPRFNISYISHHHEPRHGPIHIPEMQEVKASTFDSNRFVNRFYCSCKVVSSQHSVSSPRLSRSPFSLSVIWYMTTSDGDQLWFVVFERFGPRERYGKMFKT